MSRVPHPGQMLCDSTCLLPCLSTCSPGGQPSFSLACSPACFGCGLPFLCMSTHSNLPHADPPIQLPKSHAPANRPPRGCAVAVYNEAASIESPRAQQRSWGLDALLLTQSHPCQSKLESSRRSIAQWQEGGDVIRHGGHEPVLTLAAGASGGSARRRPAARR